MGLPAFTSRDVSTFLGSKGASKAYENLLLHKLVREGKLFRISRGVYTFHEEVQVAGFAFQPFYYGLQDALSLRNLWEQETAPLIISPRKIRKGRRIFLGSNYSVKRISRKMFFGFETIKYGEFWIPVSNVEKTLIDFVYFRQPLQADVVREMKKSIRKDVMREYLKKVPVQIARKVRMLLQ